MNSANEDRAGFAALDLHEHRERTRRKKALIDRNSAEARIQLGHRVVDIRYSDFGKRARSHAHGFKRGGVRLVHAKAGIEW